LSSFNPHYRFSGTNIRVKKIQPGMTDTDILIPALGGSKEAASKVMSSLIDEPLTSEDIAENIVFAASRPKREHIYEKILTATTAPIRTEVFNPKQA
jgi:NADP-dependent 3-hydroxy acid dehydrogenase YdfG